MLIIAALAFCLALHASPGAAASGLDEVTLQLKWTHQFQFAGYYAAAEKGYFEAEGLKVRIVEGHPGVVPAEVLVQGKADFAVDSPGVLLQRFQGMPIVVLAAVFQHSPLVLLTRRDSALTHPQQLAGKRVMITGPTDPEFLAMMANEGISIKDYVRVPHSWNVDDLIDGKVDAMTAYLTNEPYLMRRRGVEPGLIRPSQYAVDFYGDCLITTEAQIRKHPDRVEAFLKAIRKGWIYAMANPEEMADLILARYPSGKDRDALLYEASAMRELVLPELVEIGHMNGERWRHIAAVYQKLGMLGPVADLSGFLYPEFKQEQEENRYKTLRLVLAAAGLLAVAAAAGGLVLIVFNARLRRKVQERTGELEQSRYFLRKVIDSISDPVFVKDSSHRFVLTNRAMGELAGCQHMDMIGKDDKAYSPEKEVEVFLARDNLVLETGQDDVYKEQYTCQSGDVRTLITKKSLYTDSSGQKFVVGVIHDMTDSLRMQEMVAQAEKMVSLGSLAAGMAHEINNPLGIIMQSSQNLERRLFKSLDANTDAARESGLDLEAMGRYLERRGILDSVRDIRSAGERAAGIVMNMLHFSRKSGTEKGPCDVETVVESMLELVGNDYDVNRAYDFKKIEIRREYAVGCQPVHAVRNQIGQVVLNILLNAVHAMTSIPSGRQPRLTIAIRPVEGGTRLEISDNGPGMEEIVRKRIFEPFFTTKDLGEGTGLGLFVAYSIVTEGHGGTLAVESTAGEGTTFVITLPGAEATA